MQKTIVWAPKKGNSEATASSCIQRDLAQDYCKFEINILELEESFTDMILKVAYCGYFIFHTKQESRKKATIKAIAKINIKKHIKQRDLLHLRSAFSKRNEDPQQTLTLWT